jgi:hypothetical protein
MSNLKFSDFLCNTIDAAPYFENGSIDRSPKVDLLIDLLKFVRDYEDRDPELLPSLVFGFVYKEERRFLNTDISDLWHAYYTAKKRDDQTPHSRISRGGPGSKAELTFKKFMSRLLSDYDDKGNGGDSHDLHNHICASPENYVLWHMLSHVQDEDFREPTTFKQLMDDAGDAILASTEGIGTGETVKLPHLWEIWAKFQSARRATL